LTAPPQTIFHCWLPPNTLTFSYITIKNILLGLQPSSIPSFHISSFHKIYIIWTLKLFSLNLSQP
jgi:hypothetical protein